MIDGILTIKGPNVGGTRLEYEYDIPIDEAREMLNELCHKPLIEKTRYKIPFEGFIWEVDRIYWEKMKVLFSQKLN